MASNTTNYNLHKIDLTDAPPDITVLNPNWDIIDSELQLRTKMMKNVTPSSSGKSTLLEYVVSFYSTEDKVVFSNVSDFPDLPTGVTSGQAYINVSGGILTVTLTTRNETYYRGTNSLTAWTESWKVYSLGVVATTTLYVTTSGNDSTADGTQSKPFKTLTKALSVLPKNLNGKTVTISIGSGTYTEAKPIISDFYGGNLTITATTASNKPVFENGLQVLRCFANLTFTNIEVKCSASSVGIEVQYSPTVRLGDMIFNDVGTKTGMAILASNNSSLYMGGCVINNTNVCVEARASNVFIYTVSGTGNNYGLHATMGAQIGAQSANLNATIAYYTETGGRVYTGAQVNAPWN